MSADSKAALDPSDSLSTSVNRPRQRPARGCLQGHRRKPAMAVTKLPGADMRFALLKLVPATTKVASDPALVGVNGSARRQHGSATWRPNGHQHRQYRNRAHCNRRREAPSPTTATVTYSLRLPQEGHRSNRRGDHLTTRARHAPSDHDRVRDRHIRTRQSMCQGLHIPASGKDVTRPGRRCQWNVLP